MLPSDDLSFSQSLEHLKKPEVLYHERVSYADMLLNYLKNSADDVVANPLYIKSTHKVASAKLAHERKVLAVALLELDSAIIGLEALTTKRPAQAREQRRYQSLKDGLPYFYAAYQRNYLRVLEQEGEQATTDYNKARVDMLINESEQLTDHGRFGEAAVLLDEAQGLIAEAIRGMLNHQVLGTVEYVLEEDRSHLGKSPQEREQDAYQAAQDSLDAFVAAAKRVAERENRSFDDELIGWLQSEADQFAGQRRYSEAEMVLRQIGRLVARGIKDYLDGQSIVVEVDVSTPELEYRYEHNRFLGYEELIPVAIKQMRPGKESLLLINEYADQARWMAQQAGSKQKLNEWPVAIRMMQDATGVIQQALKVAGVPIYKEIPRE